MACVRPLLWIKSVFTPTLDIAEGENWFEVGKLISTRDQGQCKLASVNNGEWISLCGMMITIPSDFAAFSICPDFV
jgi:hypothetical protein